MTRVKIKGMKCQHCVEATTKALQSVPGTRDVRVDLDKGEATFEGEVSIAAIKEAILKIGFDVEE